MALSTEVQDRIKTYLWEVAGYLSGMSPASRIEVLRDLESHLHEALNARSTMPTVTDVDAVLSVMPAPASYRNEENLTPERTSANRLTWNELPGVFITWCQTLAWESFVGLGLLIIGMWTVVPGFTYIYYIISSSTQPFSSATAAPFHFGGEASVIIGYFLILLGVFSLVITALIGKSGMRRIINSNGKLHGFHGAFIAFLTPRLLLYNGVIFLLFCMGMTGGSIYHKFLMLILLLLPFSLIMYLNFLLIKYEWHKQRRNLVSVVYSH